MSLVKTPLLTVDWLIRLPGDRIVPILRKNPPVSLALPSGFLDMGDARPAVREAKEETGHSLDLTEQFFSR